MKALFILFAILSAPVHAELVDRATYESFLALTDDLWEDRAPHEWFTLGIGRGPAAVIALMQERISDSAGNVPFSAPNDDATAAVLRYDPEIHRAVYFPILGDFFPPPKMLQGRKISIIDDTISGGNLLFFAELLQDFSSFHKLDLEFVSIALMINQKLRLKEEFTKAGLIVIEKRLTPFRKVNVHITRGTYKPFAEFLNFTEVLESDGVFVPQEKYQELRQAFASWLSGECSHVVPNSN